ncbi:TPA: hypothetical protein SMN08_002299 [Proteus mirabilis]|nr:hypothetical protein [Proteus mirabilis]
MSPKAKSWLWMLAVIASGIVIMNLFSKMGSEEESEEATEIPNIKQTASSVNK